MNKYIIMTDSCVDLTSKLADELELVVVPLSVNIKGKQYFNFLDERDITSKQFYSLLKDGIVPVTSQINPNHIIDEMEKHLKTGLDILYIGFSSALSGTYNSSLIAKDELIEKYPYYTYLDIQTEEYRGFEGTIKGVAVQAMLIANENMDEDLAYNITKNIFTKLDAVGESHARGKDITVESALEGMPIELHPGAQRFFDEQ